MDPLKAAYCRTFQFFFKLAIPLLPYRSPLMLNSCAEIPEQLRSRGIRSVLIVTDLFIHQSGLIEPLKEALQAADIRYAVFDETVPNPTIQNVEDARRLYLKEGCQAIIGFGGGSAMDCAKVTGARIVRPNTPVQKLKGICRVMRRLPFTVAVPTTAGTGSETTLAALVTDRDTHHKFTINDFALIPRVAVLDAEVTRSLPPRITATTGMDALTHAVEAYIGRSTTTSTRADAIHALELIQANLLRAYRNGDDMEARRNMLLASFYAGQAFTKSYVGYCHSVAHSLGGRYNIPHGLANAVLLPHVQEAYGESAHRKLWELACALKLCDESASAKEGAERMIAMIRQMNAGMNLPETLPGIRREDIPGLAARAEREANPLYPVPKLMTAAELERFYYDVMEDAQ